MTTFTALTAAFAQNPHEVLQLLREQGPVAHTKIWGGLPVWLVTRYSEARALLTDPRVSKDYARAVTLFPADNAGTYASDLNAHMLQSDPPDHTRLRKLVVKAFTSGAVERMQTRIKAIANELLGAIEADAAPRRLDRVFRSAIADAGHRRTTRRAK